MIRTVNEAKQIVDAFLTGLTQSLGFRCVQCLRFEKRVSDVTVVLLFPCRLDPRGPGYFTCNVGLRFDSLAQWTDDENRSGPTIFQPIHFLREEKGFTEWEFSNAGDLEKLRDTILSDLKNHVLPFIERFSRLAELRKVLESPNPKDWIGLGVDVDRRVIVLAAIHLTEGDRAGAMKMLDDAVLERKAALPKRRFEIEYMRKRLGGS